MVLNWASEYGLSFEVRGRECERRTPRSTSISDTGFEVMAPPRSAWMVCGSIPLRATASARKSRATTGACQDICVSRSSVWCAGGGFVLVLQVQHVGVHPRHPDAGGGGEVLEPAPSIDTASKRARGGRFRA